MRFGRSWGEQSNSYKFSMILFLLLSHHFYQTEKAPTPKDRRLSNRAEIREILYVDAFDGLHASSASVKI
jgi:hypothetical protein